MRNRRSRFQDDDQDDDSMRIMMPREDTTRARTDVRHVQPTNCSSRFPDNDDRDDNTISRGMPPEGSTRARADVRDVHPRNRSSRFPDDDQDEISQDIPRGGSTRVREGAVRRVQPATNQSSGFPEDDDRDDNTISWAMPRGGSTRARADAVRRVLPAMNQSSEFPGDNRDDNMISRGMPREGSTRAQADVTDVGWNPKGFLTHWLSTVREDLQQTMENISVHLGVVERATGTPQLRSGDSPGTVSIEP